MADSRTNGQLWIDKNTNSLRYKSNGKYFTLSANESLTVANPSEEFEVGNLIAITKDGLKKAIFPNDLENVAGVIGITPDKDGDTFVTKQGTVVIDKSVFYYTDNNQLQVGLPVYWFIGDYKNGISSKDKAGMLTTLTPSGFKGSGNTYSGGEGYNVGYDNLPQVGMITKVGIDTVTIYVNIDKIDSSIEWNYPYLHGATDNLKNAGCEKYEPTTEGEVTINIYHGLYPDMDNEFLPKCKVNVVAIDPTKNEEYNVLCDSDFADGNNNSKYTKISIKTKESLKYRISGVINYKYDKDHEKPIGE